MDMRAIVGAITAVGILRMREDVKEERQSQKDQEYIWVESKDWPGWKQTWTRGEARRRGYDV